MSFYLRPEPRAPELRPESDLICFSHLRWNFVFQRPQHLMSRYARVQRVFFVEEPVFEDVAEPELSVEAHDGVSVVVPRLPCWLVARAGSRRCSGCCSTG